jgi:ribosomal protein S18 acetylase RimI-like enzyme
MLTIRPAVAEDNPRMAYIVFNEPDFEAVRLIGDVPRARKYGYGKIALEKIPSSHIRHTVVAEEDGLVVGLLQYALEGERLPTLSLVWLMVKTVGPIGFVRRIPRLQALRGSTIASPDGALNIDALHVDPAYQNRSIGSALLEWVGDEAARRQVKMISVSTWIGFRGINLYERNGFVEADTKYDDQYERYFGARGRVLLVKHLSPAE